MRTRRGFARLTAVAIVGAGLLVGSWISVRTERAPAVEFVVEQASTPAPQLTQREPGRAEFRYVDFRRKLLRGSLRDSTFTECDLRGADLRGVNFTGCLFSWCDLRGARLGGANLTGVLYTSETKWPAGFDPEAHGARLDE